MNILFVCSKNRWRSRTAEEIYKNLGHDIVKSAGTERSARIRVSGQHIQWADMIFVMEAKHKSHLEQWFNEHLFKKEIIVLGIADEYKFMDEELVDVIKTSVQAYVDLS